MCGITDSDIAEPFSCFLNASNGSTKNSKLPGRKLRD